MDNPAILAGQMIFVIFAIVLFLPLQVAEAQHHIDTSIRTVNWDSLLAHDTTHFKIDTENSDSIYHLGLRYKLVQDSDEGGYYGNQYYATKYTDLNRDGKDDAVVLLSNPGSGAYAVALIFLQTPQGPKFSGYAGGAHYRDTLYGDTLDIITAHWLRDDEPQCCPSAENHQRIVGERDSIRFLPLEVRPVQ